MVGYYESSGEAHGHYVDVLDKLARERGWQYGDHYVPHDAKVRELGTGKTRIETLISLGVKPKLVPAHKVEDGIHAPCAARL